MSAALAAPVAWPSERLNAPMAVTSDVCDTGTTETSACVFGIW
jgi:hypothetical protein